MAFQYSTTNGNLVIPGAYASYTVEADNSGLSTTGVLMIVGEADQGPDYTLESNLSLNAYGPDQSGDVKAKYVSGNIVEAFNSAVTASNDPAITGSLSKVIIVKTNPSTKASKALDKVTPGGTYATLADKSYGKYGNLINYTITATSEVIPTTGTFTYIPNLGAYNCAVRVDGGAEVPKTIVATRMPVDFVADINLAGVAATGGADQLIIDAAMVASGAKLALALVGAPGTFAVDISVDVGSFAVTLASPYGQTLYISATSGIAGGVGTPNAGGYVVTSATSTHIYATKLADTVGVAYGVVTPPVVAASFDITSITTDLLAYAPVVITNAAANMLNGGGKSLEIVELATGVDLISRYCYGLGTITPVTWISKVASPQLIVSATEYSVVMAINRQYDNVSETLSSVGGQFGMYICYLGTTCTLTITSTALTTTRVGGSGSDLSILLADYPTISDLAVWINNQTGYRCIVATAAVGQLPSTALDRVTALPIATSWNSLSTGMTPNGRVKLDAYRFYNALVQGSTLVQLGTTTVARADAGLPAAATLTYLSGGTKAGTTQAVFQSAIDALEGVRGNFLIPLVSRDAAGYDITDGLTESSSTYLIDSVNAYAKTHCLKMSTLKKARNRQAFCSKRGTFVAAQTAAQNLATFRCSLTFQDFNRVGSNGLYQFQPWMGACLAAGMQAAGFYRGILRKQINCSGVVQAAGDFKDANDDNMETALLAGLLPAKIPPENSGIVWASDQTTYGKDSNFVYNSIQAVYAADTIALTCAQRFDRLFVGMSVADISVGLALSALDSMMGDLKGLKLIAASDDAPKGYKNAKVKVLGSVLLVSAEVKLAGMIYFVPINFLYSPVQLSSV